MDLSALLGCPSPPAASRQKTVINLFLVNVAGIDVIFISQWPHSQLGNPPPKSSPKRPGGMQVGTPLCVPSQGSFRLGRIASMELNHKAVSTAKKGDSIALKIEATSPDEATRLYGRHFTDKVCVLLHFQWMVSNRSRKGRFQSSADVHQHGLTAAWLASRIALIAVESKGVLRKSMLCCRAGPASEPHQPEVNRPAQAALCRLHDQGGLDTRHQTQEDVWHTIEPLAAGISSQSVSG